MSVQISETWGISYLAICFSRRTLLYGDRWYRLAWRFVSWNM